MAIINIMGIDPSLTATGWCIAAVDTDTRKIVDVLEIGLVETAPTKGKQVRKSSDTLARARSIVDTLNKRMRAHAVKIGCSEVPSGAQSASASHAFGIVVGILASLPIPLIEVNPTEVKLASAGSKIADKEDIVNWALQQPGAMAAFANSENDVTSPRANDWEIQIGKRWVGKKAEHPADAVAAVQAALNTEQFRQLAGMLAALI